MTFGCMQTAWGRQARVDISVYRVRRNGKTKKRSVEVLRG